MARNVTRSSIDRDVSSEVINIDSDTDTDGDGCSIVQERPAIDAIQGKFEVCTLKMFIS